MAPKKEVNEIVIRTEPGSSSHLEVLAMLFLQGFCPISSGSAVFDPPNHPLAPTPTIFETEVGCSEPFKVIELEILE